MLATITNSIHILEAQNNKGVFLGHIRFRAMSDGSPW